MELLECKHTLYFCAVESLCPSLGSGKHTKSTNPKLDIIVAYVYILAYIGVTDSTYNVVHIGMPGVETESSP